MDALKIVALLVGGFGLTGGVLALQFPNSMQAFLRRLPRNEALGRILIAIDLVWSIYLYRQWKFEIQWKPLGIIPLHIFDPKEPGIYFLAPLIYLFIIWYVNHYLGARSVALLLILAAKPVIQICFLSDEPWSLVMTTLAYLWVVAGICFVSAPHWMRDLIHFWQGNGARWKTWCWIKMIMGAGILALGLFVY